MTIDEVIEQLKYDYNELGKGIPCDTGWGMLIDEAYSMAIEQLEKSKWKSVKDELPKDEREVLVKLNYTADYEEKYKFAGYSIARYLKFDDVGHWCDNKHGYLEWDKYSDGHGGSSWYKVVEWKEF